MRVRMLALAVLVALPGMAVAQTATQAPPKAPDRAARLTEHNEQSANQIQPPNEVMDLLGIRPGLVIGEVGAGRGRVTVHLADRVGTSGKVYANDINPQALDYLKQRVVRLGLTNVETLLGAEDDARFPANTLDMVFMAWVFHHVEQPVPLLKSLLPSLRPWGAVVMVEPTPARTESTGRALTRELVSKEAASAGFTLDAMVEGRLKEDNVFVLRPAVPDVPESRDRQKVRALWEQYLAWRKTTKGGAYPPDPRGYAVSLERDGVPWPEVRRRFQILRAQATEQPEGIEMIYDPLYSKPLTGDLAKDGFKTAPNTFLVESMKAIRPGGQALDVGAGMGRNGIHLAKLGWEVTGMDLSAGGLAVMRASAEKAGLKVQTVKSSYEAFDFGVERWDLLAVILAWVPVEEPAFLARLKRSLRPGGHIVFESNIQRTDQPFPPGVHAVQPGVLRQLFNDFDILVYREEDDYGDWGGPPTPLVRMVARKRAR